jgi:hypothetical protein
MNSEIYMIKALLRHYQILTAEIRDAKELSDIRGTSYYNILSLEKSKEATFKKIELLIPTDFLKSINIITNDTRN